MSGSDDVYGNSGISRSRDTETNTEAISGREDNPGPEKESSGLWGEGDPSSEDVNVNDAIREFEEVRQTLSKETARKNSIFSKKGRIVFDEENVISGDRDGLSHIDFEDYMRCQIHERESSGIIPKKIGVSFRRLQVTRIGTGRYIRVKTFPEGLLELFGWGYMKLFITKVQPWANKSVAAEAHPIIQGFNGVVKPGEMLLVLGKPGSGCSTFLRALTNKPRDFTNIEGEIHYSRLPFRLAKGKYRGEILYIDEEDTHIPSLTVAQTIRFALKTKTPRKRIPGTSREDFVNTMTDLFANMFAMRRAMNTVVGFVSGGQKKRTTIMEVLASNSTINAWDNSTRGLDSSTAVNYIRSLRILTNLTYSTTIVTLYQAGEQIYREFDKVCVIYAGRQIFFGKASEARGYFESLGFVPTPRTTTSDFLTTITDPKTQRLRAGMEEHVPTTPVTLETAFRKSKYWTELQDELAAYDRECEAAEESLDVKGFIQAVKEEKSRGASNNSPYTVSFARQVLYLTQRQFQLQSQDMVALRSRFINTIVLGLITGSLFYNIQHTSEGAFFIGGVLFFNIVVIGWMQLYEAIDMVLGRPITAKQTTFGFYRPSALVLAKTFADIPTLVVQSTIFTTILYWMANLIADAGKFFFNLLIVFVTTIFLTAFYRAVGVFSKDLDTSIRLAFTAFNVMCLFSGYMQPYKALKSWVYKWICWANPMAYSMEAVMINQFNGLNLECSPSDIVPGVPGASIENQVCTLPGSKPKSAVISGNDYISQFGYEPRHLWRNFGIIIAFTVLYLIVAMIGSEVMKFGSAGSSMKLVTKIPSIELPESEKKTATVPAGANKPDSEKPGSSRGAVLGIAGNTSRSADNRGSIYTWRNVNYSIGAGANERLLLQDINGYVKPGRLTALMGPSGAGKTTLLENLAMRKRVGNPSGELLMDGKGLMPDFGRSTAFVEQQDVHDEMSTVREALRFSALLRRPPTISIEDKYKFVEVIIKSLELEPLADSLIGMPGFGLSVEERKRVTIGVELASDPADLLFLDEPTSGLDANGALSIVRLLRKLADESGIAIFCTIHQPSAVLIQDFDDMLLLSQTGREVYFGPIGEGGKTVIDYFERNGASPASSGMNPAEYVLETIHDAPGDRSWPEIWKSSPESQAVLEEIESLIINTKDLPILRELRTLEYAMPLSTQIAGVTKRVWLHFWRNASYGVSKMYSNISMALIAGVLFLQSGHTVQELQSRMFAVFVLLILSPMILTSIQPKFLEFARLYETRERNSRIYSSTAWITAIVVVEILYAILGSILFFFPWYFMIGLTYSEAGFVFFFVVLFQIWIPHIAMWTAAAFPDITLLSVVNPFIFVVTNGFTGILVTYDAMPQFYSSWLYWANPLTYVVRGILAAILHNVPVICSKKELVTFTPPAGMTCGAYAGEWLRTSPHALGYILDHNTTAQCEYCQFSSGDGYLKVRNMDYETRWRDLGVFCVFIVSNVILIYGLYWVFREIRWSRIWRRFG